MAYEHYLILIGGCLNLGLLALLILGLHLRATRRDRRFELLHRERITAMEKGIPLPELPQMEDSLRPWPERVATSDPRWALVAGVLSVFLGSGYVAAILIVATSSPDAHQIWPLGLIPVFFGTGCLVLYGLLRGRK